MKIIRVMLSSRNTDLLSGIHGPIPLTDIRVELKTEIEGVQLFGQPIFEVWINELAGAQAGDQNAWDVCMDEVDRCDILVGIYNGEAGWTLHPNGLGICHAELHKAFSNSPAKLYLIKVNTTKDAAGNDIPIKSISTKKDNNILLSKFIESTTFYSSINTDEELKSSVKEIILDAIVKLTKLAKRETKKGKYHFGESLDWSRLNFIQRKTEIENILVTYFEKSLNGKREAGIEGKVVNVKGLLYVLNAIPSGFSIPEARELVGRPYLNDVNILEKVVKRKLSGPVHVIGCHKSVTESQILSFIGHPDIYIVETPFGFFCFDRSSFIQCYFLNDCRDQTSTRNNLERMFEWINRSAEYDRMIAISESRFRLLKSQLIEKTILLKKNII